MIKTITIDGKDVVFKSSAAIPRIYRLKFKRDIFSDMATIGKALQDNQELYKQHEEDLNGEEDFEKNCELASNLPIELLTTFENIAYLMNKHGDPSQPDNIDDWLDQFNTFDIYKVMPEIMELWANENQTLSVLKKKTVK